MHNAHKLLLVQQGLYQNRCYELNKVRYSSLGLFLSEARCDHKLPESSHLVPLSNHHSRSFVVALGKGLYQKICSCAVCLIRRIDHIRYCVPSEKSTLAVEIDLTWSRGFVPNPGPVALYCPPGLRMKYRVNMDDPNITMEEYIRLEEEKARRHDFEKEFPAIAYNDALTSKLDFLTEPTVSP
ncbi:hypothetical protein Tco_1531545 [Tanacetum coccineum]